MAFGLRHWIGLAVLGTLAIAVWGLPPEPRRGFRGNSDQLNPARGALTSINREMVRANALLKRLRWLDSIDAAFEDPGQEASGVVVGIPPEAPAARDLQEAVRRGAEELGLEAPGQARVGVFVVGRNQGGHERFHARALFASREYFAYRRDGRATCAVVLPVGTPSEASFREFFRFRSSDSVSNADLLGPCAFYRRYGSPGPGVDRWLTREGFHFGERPTPLQAGWNQPESFWGGQIFLEGLFGMDIDRLFGVSAAGRACLGGSVPHCWEALWRGREGRWGASSLVWLQDEGLPIMGEGRGYWNRGPFGGFEGSFLADVEAEFGKERFREFWTSDAPLEQAFEASFGQPMAEWVMTWAQARLGSEARGPGLRAGTLALSLLMVGLFAGGGVAVVARRKAV